MNCACREGEFEMDLKTAKETFLAKHDCSDERIDSFNEHVDEWIASLPQEIVSLVLSMISSFDYYSHREANIMLGRLHDELGRDFGFNDNTALHTYIKKKDGRICSSVDYWAEYKSINKIDKNLCSDDLREIPESEWALIENIVIIDDCCGTGGSLEKFIELSKRDFSGKTIYYVVLHALEAAKEKIIQIEEKYSLCIHLVAINIRELAIQIVAPDNAEDTRKQIIKASRKMHIGKDYALGKDNSEGLMAFYNNTPNNTIGLFWCPSDRNNPIFPRDFGTTPPWRPSINSMQKAKDQRKKDNYVAVKKRG